MNEQLQQALAAILNKTMAGVEAGASFLQSELPDVVQQLLIWKAAESLIYGVIGVVLAVFIYKTTRAQFNQKLAAEGSRRRFQPNMIYDEDGDMHAGVVFFGAVVFFAGILSLAMIEGLKNALQIWLAPKIYLIEYAASLAK